MDPAQFLLPKYRHFEKEYKALSQCNRCGFCETACPTYVASGKETFSPRGRNQAFRQILEGQLTDAAQAGEIFSTCLTCHACTNVCFAQVPVGKLMARARNIASAGEMLRPIQLAVMRAALMHRKILSCLLWAGLFFKRLKLSAFIRKLGLLKLISKELEAADELVSQTPWKFGAGIPQVNQSDAARGSVKTAYFSGCGIHYLYPGASQSCADILSRNSKAQFPNHSCCGLPAQSQGDLDGAKKMAKKNIEQFSRLGVDWIVVNDGSCAGIMKNYGELLDGDPTAVRFSKKVKTFSEALSLLDAKDGDLIKSLANSSRRTVKATYHDPCQVGNGHHIYEPPRAIIREMPGIQFAEMEESNSCCGGAGTYCLKHPRLAEDVLEMKIDRILESGAEIVLTEASSCLLHVNYGLRKKGMNGRIKILHLGEFLNGK